ncbi:MAG: TonB-dependent receptor [Gammaproteobacteria bacterium]|nr:TonB-dependent receptor [Gammaproteobacteria bacterium]MBV9619739.1 TonB-dependent receptor [Gammaproteobacteria bacterium]
MTSPSIACRALARRALLLCLLPLHLPAAEAPAADALQGVVVTATRLPTPPLEVASSLTVVTAADIEARQQRTFAEVLQNVPGLNVVQEGGAGGETSVFMRGTNSNHTKVLIDGIDVSDPSNANGAFDFGSLLADDIERVEVLRGPQSGLYGSDAIGGVINIITKSGQGPAQLFARAEGGSFDTFNQSASLRGGEEPWHYAANLTHLHVGATPVTPPELLLPGEARHDDKYDNLTASTKLALTLSPALDLGLVGRTTHANLHYTGEDFDPVTFAGFPAPEQSRSRVDDTYARLTAHWVAFGGAFDQTLGAAYTRSRTATFQPQLAEIDNDGTRRKFDWQGALHLAPETTLLLGAEQERAEISAPLSASLRINSGYAELESSPGAGVFTALNVRYDDNDRFGSEVTYRLAPTWVSASTGTKLKASVGTGFKAPTLSELYQDFPPFFFANPRLRPETSTGYEAGLEQRLAPPLRAGVTYFYNRIRNLITADATGSTWANIGRANTEGVESFIAFEPRGAFSARLDYTYTEATDATLHQELLRRPRHRGALEARWQPSPDWLLDVNLLSVGAWTDGSRDFSVPRLRAPGYTTVNVAGRCTLSPRVSVLARLDNLFDRRYQNPVGFLHPGFGAFAGLEVTL